MILKYFVQVIFNTGTFLIKTVRKDENKNEFKHQLNLSFKY